MRSKNWCNGGFIVYLSPHSKNEFLGSADALSRPGTGPELPSDGGEDSTSVAGSSGTGLAGENSKGSLCPGLSLNIAIREDIIYRVVTTQRLSSSSIV